MLKNGYYLIALLEASDSFVVLRNGAPDYDQGPAVDLRVGHAACAVQQARPGNDQAGSGSSGQIAHSLGRVAGRLLVPHAYIMDAGHLEGRAQLDDGKTNNAEHIFDALNQIRFI